MTIKQLVAVTRTDVNYPDFPYIGSDGRDLSVAIKNLLASLGLDSANINKPNWNPFSDFVAPGQSVLIKPNWVLDVNRRGDMDCLVTHSSVIRPLIDFSLKALGGKGRIVIADAPLQSCNFERLQDHVRMNDLIAEYQEDFPNVEFIVEDWRLTVMERTKFLGKERNTPNRVNRSINDDRYQVVNVGNDSLLVDIEDYADRFRVTCYDPELLVRHHQFGKHEYLVSRRVLESDLVINVPKMKTHIKSGMTGAMKNLIGINGHKEYLPHHIKGAYESGGDNYLLASKFKSLVENLDEWFWKRSSKFSPLLGNTMLRGIGILWRLARFVSGDGRDAGSWSGNETIWRTMLDLNHILYFYDIKTNSFLDAPARKVLHIMDGIVAGEGEGPLEPSPVPSGKLIGGFSPVAVDAVAATSMGYNISRLHSIYHGLYNIKSRFNIRENGVIKIREEKDGIYHELNLHDIISDDFVLPKYWRCASRGSYGVSG